MIWFILKIMLLISLIRIININHMTFILLCKANDQDVNLKRLYYINRYFLFTLIAIISYGIVNELHKFLH